jgi:hypothetical protein
MKFDSIIRDRMMVFMDIDSEWCQEHGLSADPSKAVLKQYIPYKTEFKYLGVTKIRSKTHMECTFSIRV